LRDGTPTSWPVANFGAFTAAAIGGGSPSTSLSGTIYPSRQLSRLAALAFA
jgi:hypothetical protein